MVIKPMMLMLKFCYLIQHLISHNGYIRDLLFHSALLMFELPDHSQLRSYDQIVVSVCNLRLLPIMTIIQLFYLWQHLTKMTQSFCSLHVCLIASIKLTQLLIPWWDIGNSLFQSTLGMPRHVWPHPTKMK